jgi:hypothetical protein
MPKKIFNSDLETSGQVIASTLTDGTATLSGGVFTASTLTDGTATLSGGVFTASTITDGTATLSGGDINASVATFDSISAASVTTDSLTTEFIEATATNLNLKSEGAINIGLDTDGTGGSNKLIIYDNAPTAVSTNANTVIEIDANDSQVIMDVFGHIGCDSLGARGEDTPHIELNELDTVIRSDLMCYNPLGFKKEISNPGTTEDSNQVTMEAYLQQLDGTGEICGLKINIPPARELKFTGGGDVIVDADLTFTGGGDVIVDADLTFTGVGDVIVAADLTFTGGGDLTFTGGADLKFTGGGDVIVNGDNDSTEFYLPNLTADNDGTNSTISHSIGVTANGLVLKDPNSTFFTGKHVYPSEEVLSVGGAAYLDSNTTYLSSTANSSICIGIVVRSYEVTTQEACSLFEFTDENKPSYLVEVAAVGDSRHRGCQGFNVCNENGDIQPGDLLVTSNTPGYLMKQDDDIMRSKTVGKAMEAVTFDDNGQATGVYGFIYCG